MNSSCRRGPDGLTDLERDLCHAVDKGLTNREAYRVVRPGSKASGVTAEKYVWGVRQRPHCAAYLRELKAQSLARHHDAKDRIIEALASLAFADIWDLMTEGPDGLTVKPLEALPPGQRGAVASLSVSRTYYGGTIRLKMHDRIRALDKLCQLFGLYEPGARAGADSAAVAALSDVERAQRLAAILRLADDKKTDGAAGG